MPAALNISHLRKVYRRGNVAVKDLTMTIAEGDFFGFLGPNGAGKSTTIHCVTGIATITSGIVEVFGIDAVKNYREARRMIGLSPQEFNVDQFATPRQIVDWMGGYFGMSAAQRKSRTDMLLERFDLTDHAKKSFRELSGGLKRRVILARALVHDPALLILDEPTAGVDVELRQTLWQFIARLNREGHTVLLTTHYLEEAEALCQRIAMLKQGRVVALERTSELLAGTATTMLRFKTDHALPASLAERARVTGRFAQVSARDANDVEAVLAQLREAGVPIEDLEIGRSDLEDVFLNIMTSESKQ